MSSPIHFVGIDAFPESFWYFAPTPLVSPVSGIQTSHPIHQLVQPEFCQQVTQTQDREHAYAENS